MATILIIDDEPTIRRLIRRSLESQGHRILEAADGILGLKLAMLEQPDLVLLDIALPQMSGLEVNRKLQANPQTSTIPVLYLSGLIPDSLRSAANERAYITKPFSPQSLIDQVSSALPKRPALT